MYYVLKRCSKHGMVQWAVSGSFAFCCPCLVEDAVKSQVHGYHDAGLEPPTVREYLTAPTERLIPRRIHLESD